MCSWGCGGCGYEHILCCPWAPCDFVWGRSSHSPGVLAFWVDELTLQLPQICWSLPIILQHWACRREPLSLTLYVGPWELNSDPPAFKESSSPSDSKVLTLKTKLYYLLDKGFGKMYCSHLILFKRLPSGWERGGSAAKITGCSYKGLRFDSQHPRSGS